MPLQQLTPRIYQLSFSEAEDRPCLGYIRGERFSLMVDAGNSPEHVRDYQQALREAGFPLPQFTVLTHSHWDHCFGLHALQIPAIACAETRASLEMVSRLRWTPEALHENAEKGIVPRLCVPRIQAHFPEPEKIRIALPSLIFSGSMRLDLGNCMCIFQHVTSAHARDTVIVFVPSERMVFLGDCIYQQLIDDVWKEGPVKLKQLIQELEPLDFILAQPAHQGAMSKEELLNWLNRRLQKASAPAFVSP